MAPTWWAKGRELGRSGHVAAVRRSGLILEHHAVRQHHRPGGCTESGSMAHGGGNVSWGGRPGGRFLGKLNTGSPHDPAVPLLRIYRREVKAGTPHRYSHPVGTATTDGRHPSVPQRVKDTHGAVHPHAGTRSRLRKEGP